MYIADQRAPGQFASPGFSEVAPAAPSRACLIASINFVCPDPTQITPRRRILSMAVCDAIACAEAARAAALDPKNHQRIDTLFGVNPVQPPWCAKEVISSRFAAVARALEARTTKYICDPCSGPCECDPDGVPAGPERPRVFGQFPGGQALCCVDDTVARAMIGLDEIRLCPKFWSLKRFEKAATLIHEMLHLLSHLFCEPFRHDPTTERRRNSAYCYEAFALEACGHPVPSTVVSKCQARPAN